jgi:hypothetical protein
MMRSYELQSSYYHRKTDVEGKIRENARLRAI